MINLAALWAGPLCAHLLGTAGARVLTVESTARPDGSRLGTPAFHDLLHAEQESVALDLDTGHGRESLRDLLARADIVIEGSRPRAMTGLGIEPAALAEEGTLWVSITAYGRTGPWANRPGFGDDVAAAAGLVIPGEPPLFCGDAIADPLTGMVAAVAALARWLQGTAGVLDVSMRDVVAATLGAADPTVHPVARPIVRPAAGRAPTLGADTDRVLAELLR